MAEFAPIFDVVFKPRVVIKAQPTAAEEDGGAQGKAAVKLIHWPMMAELRTLLVGALREFDEARRAVVEALLPWEEKWGLAGAL
jgi:hypothetical protein